MVRAGTSLLTATRVEEGSGYVRVMGPGKADVNGNAALSSFLRLRFSSSVSDMVTRFAM